jgi:hypothetical protein
VPWQIRIEPKEAREQKESIRLLFVNQKKQKNIAHLACAVSEGERELIRKHNEIFRRKNTSQS